MKKSNSKFVNKPRLVNVAQTARPNPPLGGLTVPSSTGTYITPDIALAYFAVTACVKQITAPIAALDWLEYESKPDGSSTVISSSRLSRLLNRAPNPEMTPKTFKETLLLSALLCRGGYAEIERDQSGRPVALWPLPPWTVTPERSSNGGQLIHKVTISNFNEPDKATIVELEERDIFRVIGLSWDGVSGIPLYQMGAATIALGIAAEQFAGSFYRNGVIPNGVIENPGFLDKEVVDGLLAEFYSRYQGASKAGQPLYLDNGLTYKPLTVKMVDAEFNSSRRETALQICGFFGVPPHKVGLEASAGYGSSIALSKEFERSTLLPWVIGLEQEANRKLVSAWTDRRYTKMNFETLLRGTQAERYEAYAKGIQFGFLTPNRVAQMEGFDLYPDGDLRLNLANMTTSEGIEATIKRIQAETLQIMKGLEKEDESEDSDMEDEDPSSSNEDTVELVSQLSSVSPVTLNLELGGFQISVANNEGSREPTQVNVQLPPPPEVTVNNSHTIEPTFTMPEVKVDITNVPNNMVRVEPVIDVSAPVIQVSIESPEVIVPVQVAAADPPNVIIESSPILFQPDIKVPVMPAAEVYIMTPNTVVEETSDVITK